MNTDIWCLDRKRCIFPPNAWHLLLVNRLDIFTSKNINNSKISKRLQFAYYRTFAKKNSAPLTFNDNNDTIFLIDLEFSSGHRHGHEYIDVSCKIAVAWESVFKLREMVYNIPTVPSKPFKWIVPKTIDKLTMWFLSEYCKLVPSSRPISKKTPASRYCFAFRSISRVRDGLWFCHTK